MKTINKIMTMIGSFLMGIGVIMFMYNTNNKMRIYLIISGLIIVGISILSLVFDRSKPSMRKTIYENDDKFNR